MHTVFSLNQRITQRSIKSNTPIIKANMTIKIIPHIVHLLKCISKINDIIDIGTNNNTGVISIFLIALSINTFKISNTYFHKHIKSKIENPPKEYPFT